MGSICSKGKKTFYIGLSLIAVWILTYMYYLSMQGLMQDEDSVRAIVGAFGQWLIMPMVLVSLVQLLVLILGHIYRNKRFILIICFVLELLFFVVANILCLVLWGGIAMVNVLAGILLIVIFEIVNVLGVVCLVKEIKEL